MENNFVCRDCKYFGACGNADRTEKCEGKAKKLLTHNDFTYGVIKKKADGGIVWIGVAKDRKLYSTNYYRYNGILGGVNNIKDTIKNINALINQCIEDGYTEV